MAYPEDITFRGIVTCLIAATGGLLFGYDTGITGGVTSMPSFLKTFFLSVYNEEMSYKSTNRYCHFNSATLTWFMSSLYLAALIASMVAAFVTRKWGRRASMTVGGLLFFAGAIINAFAQYVAMLIVGRILLGFGVGFVNQSVPLYLSEMATYKFRGSINIAFQLSITLGIVLANLLNYFFEKIDEWGWRLSLGVAVVPALIIIFGSVYLPDTPYLVITHGSHEEAKEELRRLRGVDGVDEEFNDLLAATENCNMTKHPWMKLLQRKQRPYLVMAVAIPLFQQLSGINLIMLFGPVLFKTFGYHKSANDSLMCAIVTGAFNLVATSVAIYGVDRWGRRFLFLIGGLQMFICQVVVAILLGTEFGVSGTTTILPKWYPAVSVLVVCLYVSAFAWSWGPLGWLVPSEIFPMEIRSAAQSTSVCINMFFTFIVAQLSLTMLCRFRFGLFLFFGFFVLGMSIFICLFLPETKGVPIEKMNIIWKRHWFWGKYIPDDDLPHEENAL